MKAASVMMALAVAAPALAQPDAFFGTRCSPEEVVYIEADGIGFNEHTMCNWLVAPTIKATSVAGSVECRNVYVLDMSTDPVTTEIQELGTRHLRMVLVNNDEMDVYLDSVPAGRFGACG